jgi:hypothetical protein
VNRLVVSVIAFTLLSAQVGFALGKRGAERPPQRETERTSLQLVAESLVRGEIDEDTATLYRVYSVVDDSKLPAAYRSNAPIRDGTSVLREARSRYSSLRSEIQEELEPYLFPRGKK